MKKNDGKISILSFFIGFVLVVILIGVYVTILDNNSNDKVAVEEKNETVKENDEENKISKTEKDDSKLDVNETKNSEIKTLKPSEKIEKIFKDDEEAINYYIDYNDYYEFYGNEIGLGDGIWSGLKGEYNASSIYKEDVAKYDADNLENLFTENCWCEGVNGDGIGETIEIEAFATCEKVEWENSKRSMNSLEDVIDYLVSDFNNDPAKGEKEKITKDNISNYHSELNKIAIINGNAKTDELWKNNSRVKKMKLIIDETEEYIIELDDCKDLQIFDINYTNKSITEKINLKFEILEVYPGEKYEDTCLTSIYLVGGSEVKWGGR